MRFSARSFQPRVDHAWQVQQTEPSGVAESHAVKIKKKDRNRAISAIYSDVAAAKSHKWKKERKKKRPGATSRCLGPLRLHTAFSCKPLAAERRMLKAMCGHFIWDTLSVLRGRGTEYHKATSHWGLILPCEHLHCKRFPEDLRFVHKYNQTWNARSDHTLAVSGVFHKVIFTPICLPKRCPTLPGNQLQHPGTQHCQRPKTLPYTNSQKTRLCKRL